MHKLQSLNHDQSRQELTIVGADCLSMTKTHFYCIILACACMCAAIRLIQLESDPTVQGVCMRFKLFPGPTCT